MRTSQSNKAADGPDSSVSSSSPTLTTPPNGRTYSRQQQRSPTLVAKRTSSRMAQKRGRAVVEIEQALPEQEVLKTLQSRGPSGTHKRPRVEEADAPDAEAAPSPPKRRAILIRKDAQVPTPFNRVKSAKATSPGMSTRYGFDRKNIVHAPACRPPTVVIPWFHICEAGFLPDARGYAAYVSKLQDEDQFAATADVQVIFWYHVVEAGLPNDRISYSEYFDMLKRQQLRLVDPGSQLRGYEPKYNPKGAPFLGIDGGRYRWHMGKLERSRDFCSLNGTNWYPILQRRNDSFASSFLRVRQTAASTRWKESFNSCTRGELCVPEWSVQTGSLGVGGGGRG